LIDCYICAYVCSREIDEGDRLTPQHMWTEAQGLLWCEIDKPRSDCTSFVPSTSLVRRGSLAASHIWRAADITSWRMENGHSIRQYILPVQRNFNLSKKRLSHRRTPRDRASNSSGSSARFNCGVATSQSSGSTRPDNC
jgi:hypothetical protein